MAIIKLGALVVGIRGTVGGVTYSQNGSGPFAKSFARGADPRSTKQDAQRATLANSARSWADLSDAQRSAWDTWAALPAQEKVNPLGEAYYLSGYQWYVTVQNWLATAGRLPTTAPPTTARPTAPTITSLTVDVNGAPASNILYPAGEFGLGPPKVWSLYKPCRLGTTDGSAVEWTNPRYNEVLDAQSATVTLPAYATSSRLLATGYISTMPSTATIIGVRVDSAYTRALNTLERGIIIANAPVGTPKTVDGTVDGSYRYWGSSSDLWGTTFTPAEVNTNASGTYMRLTDLGVGSVGAEDNAFNTWYYTLPLPDPTDCVIEIFLATSPGKTTKTSGYRLLLATQAPGNTTVEFQTELEALGGAPLPGTKYFARVYRQTPDGNRSTPTTITDIAS